MVPNLKERNSEEDKQLIQSLAERIKDPQRGVTLKDRTYHLKSYKNCFVGKVREMYYIYISIHLYYIFIMELNIEYSSSPSYYYYLLILLQR